ncbi:MAG: hypothetical protein NTX00_01770 [Candidatus Parcubacteria bacterium]|nr:hypothetical protein [Candidatus Parcubacteria bacterium]
MGILFWLAIVLSVIAILVSIECIVNLFQEKEEILSIMIGVVSITILVLACVFIHTSIMKHYFPPEKVIQTKISEIQDLRKRLNEKQDELGKLILEYQQGVNDLKKAVKRYSRRHQINTFELAQKDNEISYNLALIQKKVAYIQKLQQLVARMQQGMQELQYLENQAIDDLKIVKALKSEDTDKLISDINTVITKYLPEAGTLPINIDEKNLPSPEQIWEEIIKGK